MANLQKLIDLDGLSYFLGQIKAKFVRSVNGVKPDSKGNVEVPQISKNEIVNYIYPVGSLYWSSKSTDPATLFGGTWKRIKDKFILAAGDTYAAGATGGEATHTLTVNEMPAHSHSASSSNTGEHTHTFGRPKGDVTYSNGNQNPWWGPRYNATETTHSAGSHSHTITVNSTGSGNAHNNMPPYVTYYCWERTA